MFINDKIVVFLQSFTKWVDVNPCDGNLLAAGGTDNGIKVFDRRRWDVVKDFENIHSSMYVHCSI